MIVLQSMMGTHHFSFKMRWYEKHYLVAHAAGGIDNITYSNCLEAFEQNYKKGHRVFEFDLSLTSDGILVAEHDWQSYYTKIGVEHEASELISIPTHGEFISKKLYDKYTPLDIHKIIELMVKYEDVYIMTDFKHSQEMSNIVPAFQQIVDTAHELNCPEILDRFIVQIYNYDFLNMVNSVYKFDNYLFTCYYASESERKVENLIPFCVENDIPVITMWTHWLSDKDAEATRKHNIRIYVHTENELTAANKYFSGGASGIYTDFLTYEDVAVPEMSK